eukprot:scaffold60466_cov48-Phaeocystis_antarctica.AAC.1
MAAREAVPPPASAPTQSMHRIRKEGGWWKWDRWWKWDQMARWGGGGRRDSPRAERPPHALVPHSPRAREPAPHTQHARCACRIVCALRQSDAPLRQAHPARPRRLHAAQPAQRVGSAPERRGSAIARRGRAPLLPRAHPPRVREPFQRSAGART